MNRIAALVLSAVLGGTWPATAQDGALERVVNEWLEGRDETSLPELAALARGGNITAQVLLGRIEVMDLGPSRYRLSLDREGYREIFRQVEPGVRFGKTWLRVADETGDLRAGALRRSQGAEVDPGLVAMLFALGEPQASSHPIRILSLYGTVEQKQALTESEVLLEELKPYLAYLRDAPRPQASGMAALEAIAPQELGPIADGDKAAMGMAGILSLGWGFGDLSEDNAWRGLVEDWLLSAPETRPVAGLCTQYCPDAPGSCAFAVMALTGGYYEVIRIDSPAETIIPQDVYLESPRARMMALRRAALNRSETGKPLANTSEIAQVSACAARLVAKERAPAK